MAIVLQINNVVFGKVGVVIIDPLPRGIEEGKKEQNGKREKDQTCYRQSGQRCSFVSWLFYGDAYSIVYKISRMRKLKKI